MKAAKKLTVESSATSGEHKGDKGNFWWFASKIKIVAIQKIKSRIRSMKDS